LDLGEIGGLGEVNGDLNLGEIGEVSGGVEVRLGGD
jgi:hypothetical protein